MVYSNIEYGGDKPYNNFRISNSTARAPELRCFLYGFLLRCFLWVLVALLIMGSCCAVFYGFLLPCFLWVLVTLFFMGSCYAVFYGFLLRCFLWVLVALFFMGSCCAVCMGSCCAVFLWVLIALFFYGFLLRCFFMGSCCSVFSFLCSIFSIIVNLYFFFVLLFYFEWSFLLTLWYLQAFLQRQVGDLLYMIRNEFTLLFWIILLHSCSINVRENRKGKQEWPFQRLLI
jgi:hypothetical protein